MAAHLKAVDLEVAVFVSDRLKVFGMDLHFGERNRLPVFIDDTAHDAAVPVAPVQFAVRQIVIGGGIDVLLLGGPFGNGEKSGQSQAEKQQGVSHRYFSSSR